MVSFKNGFESKLVFSKSFPKLFLFSFLISNILFPNILFDLFPENKSLFLSVLVLNKDIFLFCSDSLFSP